MGVAKMQERDEAGSGHVARSCDTCMVAHVNVVSSPLEIRDIGRVDAKGCAAVCAVCQVVLAMRKVFR